MADGPIEPGAPSPYSSDMEASVAVLEQIAKSTVAALERIDRRMDGFDRRFELFDRRFESFDRRLDTLNASGRADFSWMLGIMLGGFGGLLGVMADGFHWL